MLHKIITKKKKKKSPFILNLQIKTVLEIKNVLETVSLYEGIGLPIQRSLVQNQ